MKLSIIKRCRLAFKRRAASLFTGEGKSFPPLVVDRQRHKVEEPTMHVMHDIGELPVGWYEEPKDAVYGDQGP